MIFYLIECPNERLILDQKKAYFKWEERSIYRIILNIEKVIRQIRSKYGNNRLELNKSIRIYKRFALNGIDKAVYWYILNMYHLSDQESNKAKILRSEHPEIIWLHHFSNNFGQMYALRNYTEQLSLRYWEIALEENANAIVVRRKMNAALFRFKTLTGLTHLFTPTWTFWNALFLAVTTYTTIGYGNITANSKLGRLAIMFYATIGIPLLLTILHKLGRQSFRILEQFWIQFLRLLEHIAGICFGKPIKKKNQNMIHNGNVPLLLPPAYSQSTYIRLTSVNLYPLDHQSTYIRDVTPTNSVDMFVIFGLIMIGLALFSMCISVLQIKLEWLFEELLVTLLEEYKEKGVPLERIKVPTKIDLLSLWRIKRKRKTQKTERKVIFASTVLPRFKRDQRALLEHIRHAFCMVNKGTQTDRHITQACINMDNSRYFDGVSWSELSMLPTTENDLPPIKAKIMKNIDHQVVIVSSEICKAQELCMTTVTDTSVMSRNASIRNGQQSSSVDDESEKWTFVKTTESTPFQSRTVEEPCYMYTRPKTRRIYTDELHRLIAEVKARIVDCRALADSKSSAQFGGAGQSSSNTNNS
uniref:Ion_trans_2 domain-containing protein n=1 Tax=Loa loa TaxID=7209 RepID=A0A1I7W443_LOALO